MSSGRFSCGFKYSGSSWATSRGRTSAWLARALGLLSIGFGPKGHGTHNN